MRILLAQNSRYFPAHGGGDKSNRLLLEALAARGHTCAAVARISAPGPEGHAGYLAELAARGVPVLAADGGVVSYDWNGVRVHIVTNANLRAAFAARVREFDPDVIVASTDDPAQILLEVALQAGRARVVYLARATLAVPFGPDGAFPSAPRTAAIAQADLVVGVSEYVAGYVRRHAGIPAVHVPISLLEPGPWPELGSPDNEFVTLVNPCAVKGISIFLALAARLPQVRFAAVPTWGTNEQDRAALARLPNISVLPPVDRIDDLLARTRVLLVPSLWAEARSRIVLEAMLRAIPVAASNVGGIPEAKLGVPYLLPVRPIAHYQPRTDDQMVPVAEVPEQDSGPWEAALRRLLEDPAHYRAIARASRDAALAYAVNLSAAPFEALLEDTLRKPHRARAQTAAAVPSSALDQLSPERRRLLALRLRQKSAAAVWFPEAARPAGLRLFGFPHAGGGSTSFARWGERLPARVTLCPARLPGRESRAAETPFREMAALVAELAAAIQPFTAEPFAFFGHSMGAIVAFELARELRRRGQPLPRCLFVSGARAPQFRLHHTPPPDPSDEQLLDRIRRLDGLPQPVLESPELLRLLMPALRADAALYTRYVYQPESPLACDIRAYGGCEDANISREHLERWAEQTTASFAVHQFPGGHFYLQTAADEFLSALHEDLLLVSNPRPL